jgi:hypothetical protein
MNAVAYLPRRDELVAGTGTGDGGGSLESGVLRLWWDRDLVIRRVVIVDATRQLREFRRATRIVPLAGALGRVRITDADIKESRRELLERLETEW